MTSRHEDVASPKRGAKYFVVLSRQILRHANLGPPRVEFLRRVSTLLLEFSDCDALELHLFGDIRYRWRATSRPEKSFSFQLIDCDVVGDDPLPRGDCDSQDLTPLTQTALPGHFEPSSPCFTEHGSFWTGDLVKALADQSTGQDNRSGLTTGVASLAIIPFVIDDKNVGLLRLECEQQGLFSPETIAFYEGVGQTLGVAIADRRAQAALRERVKELTCLYGIASATRRPDYSVQSVLEKITALIPPAWQYPDVAVSRIVLDDKEYGTTDFEATRFRQSAKIVVGGAQRGTVEVGYVDEKPEFVEGPFLEEEDDLLGAVAREISLFIEQYETASQRGQLEEQLRHADRLATIGQLAAGVAHEINEPLGGILGCAQLARKAPDLAQQTSADLDDIIAASLHVREIVKKLMLFGRQTPARRTQVDLNQIVEEGMFFLEARCAKEGVDLVQHLAPDLPVIVADPSQLQQVLVNLVVNALQAMSGGGTLTVMTRADDTSVVLVVEDTGVGMSDDVKRQIYDPFFTTKDVGEGTGLGLSVVYGIVASHQGSIDCNSALGSGTHFEIQLPRPGSPDPDMPQDGENE